MSPIKYSSLVCHKQDLLLKGTYKNIFQNPKLIKISLNLGIPDIAQEKKKILLSLMSLEAISGQSAITTLSKKINPSLKIRRGMILGSKVTLRNDNAFTFLGRLGTMVMPQIRNLQILRLSSDTHLSFRIANPLTFLELENKFTLFTNLTFLDITLVSTTANKLENTLLFSQFLLPFYKKKG